MAMRKVILSVIVAWGSSGYGQESIHLDASFTPELRPGTYSVGSALPFPDGRVAVVEFWEEAQQYVHVDLACLDAGGAKDPGFMGFTGIRKLFPVDEETFFSWQYWSGGRIHRHSMMNGALDSSYHAPPLDLPATYGFVDLQDVSMDGQGRAYLLGDILLSDTMAGFSGHYNVVRLDQNGELDHGFTPAFASSVYAAFPLPDGRVMLACGGHFHGNIVPKLLIVNEDGSMDPNFQTDFFHALPMSVLPTPDGGVIVTGRFIAFISLVELDTLFVVKLMPDGTRDPSFNVNLRPYQNSLSGQYTLVMSIVPWDPDHYLISGNFDRVNGLPKRGMAMIDVHGDLVTEACAWPGPGPASAPVSGPASEPSLAVSLVTDEVGRVYAYGNFNGFDDGVNTSSSRGIVRFTRSDVGVAGPDGESVAVRLYPIPARATAWIEWEQEDPVISAALYGGVGRWSRTIPITAGAGRAVVDLSGLPGGSYFVQVIHRSGLQSTLRTLVMP